MMRITSTVLLAAAVAESASDYTWRCAADVDATQAFAAGDCGGADCHGGAVCCIKAAADSERKCIQGQYSRCRHLPVPIRCSSRVHQQPQPDLYQNDRLPLFSRILDSSTSMGTAPPPAPAVLLYQAEITVSLVNMTLEELTDATQSALVTAISTTVGCHDSQVHINAVVESAENDALPEHRRRRRRRALHVNSERRIETPAPAVDVTFELGNGFSALSCDAAEAWAQRFDPQQVLALLQASNINVTDVVQGAPYAMVASDPATGIPAYPPAATCDQLLGRTGANAVGGSGGGDGLSEKARAGIISAVMIVAIAICVGCSLYAREGGRKGLQDGAPLVAAGKGDPGSLESGVADTTTNSSNASAVGAAACLTEGKGMWAVVPLSRDCIPPPNVLTLEAAFANPIAKENLRLFMIETHMEEAYLFFEKLADHVSRTRPVGPIQAAAFKQQIMDEFIAQDALRQLNISEELRRGAAESSPTDLSSLLPVLREVHATVLAVTWPRWLASDGLEAMMTSDAMRLTGITCVADAQSQREAAARTPVGAWHHPSAKARHALQGRAAAALCPLWGAFPQQQQQQQAPPPPPLLPQVAQKAAQLARLNKNGASQ